MATLFDDPMVLLRYVCHKGQAEYRATSSVFAPCCNRRTSADAVRDVRAIPNTAVSPGRKGVGTDQDWLCDACSSRMIRDGRRKRIRAIRTGRKIPNNVWTAPKYARAIGEPWEVIRDARAREIVQERSLTESVGDLDQAILAEFEKLGDVDGNDPATIPPTGEEPPTP